MAANLAAVSVPGVQERTRTDERDVARLVRRLSLPTFGLALAMSVLTTYAPVLLGEATESGAAIGLALGAEGLFALFLPLAVGSLSDRTSSRFGRRLPYAVFAAPLLVAPLALVPFASSYAATVALVSLFFVGYFVYYPPYQALFAELVPASHHGRAQGAQGVPAVSGSARRSSAAGSSSRSGRRSPSCSAPPPSSSRPPRSFARCASRPVPPPRRR